VDQPALDRIRRAGQPVAMRLHRRDQSGCARDA
jgi:hypothetical protein